VLERLGRQAEAAQQYRLASAGVDAPQHAAARLGLARCQIALGNPDLAEVMVDALDDAVPATDRADAVDRGLVRARAQLLREEYVNSLASIDQLERGGLAARHSVEAMELRALCFEGLDLGREAARFWLVFARESRGAVADAAFERAAQLAAADDDPLGVMFVAAEAARAGSDAALGRLARAARLDLGLAVDLDTADTTDEERVEVCERWLAEGRVVAARPVLQVLHGRRTELPATLRPRAALAYARALHSEAGLEPALLALREGRAAIADPAERRSLDLLAAELLESAEQFQRAVAAYEGRY
jgi:hypothetical protein